MTDRRPARGPEDADVAVEFGRLTENEAMPRRKAINVLARRLGIRPNDVYAPLERAKKSVIRPT
jgi:hypothetical protein